MENTDSSEEKKVENEESSPLLQESGPGVAEEVKSVEEPHPNIEPICCSFGSGKNSAHHDFDLTGDGFKIVVKCGDPDKLVFDISGTTPTSLHNGSLVTVEDAQPKRFVTNSHYNGEHGPLKFYVRAQLEGEEDKEDDPKDFLCCTIGKKSKKFDFWKGRTGNFVIQVRLADPTRIHFNVSHSKALCDTRWYTDLKTGSEVPSEQNPKHNPFHKTYVSGAYLEGKEFDPGQFWVFVLPIHVPFPVTVLTTENAQECLQLLSPWIVTDHEPFQMGRYEDYVANSMLAVIGAGGCCSCCCRGCSCSNCCREVLLKTKALPFFQSEDPEAEIKKALLDEDVDANVPFEVQVLMHPNDYEGEEELVRLNNLPVYVSLLKVPEDANLVDIVYYYWWPYQGRTFLRTSPCCCRIRLPFSAHTSDWESIVVRCKRNDVLNPIAYWTSRHGDLKKGHKTDGPGFTASKFAQNRKCVGRNGMDFGCFYAAQHIHAIYELPGEDIVSFATRDYHNSGDVCLEGGKVKLVFCNAFDNNEFEAVTKNKELLQMLKWPYDFGLHIPGSHKSITQEAEVTKKWKTSNGPRNWASRDGRFEK